MANQIRECLHCHREFLASRANNVYCSNRCRQAAYRLRHRGRILSPGPAPAAPPPRNVSTDDVALAVVSIRGALAVLGAGRITGKPGVRELCESLERGILAALEEVGL